MALLGYDQGHIWIDHGNIAVHHLVLTDALLVGHPTLDAEHVTLSALVNECIDIAVSGDGADVLEPKLAKLGEVLRSHVQNEETIMEEVSYEISPEEKRHHREGLQAFSSLQRQLSEGGAVKDIVLEVKNLILLTFLKTDMGLKGYLPEVRGL